MGFLVWASLLCQGISSSAVCENGGGICVPGQDEVSFLQVQKTLALGAGQSQEVVDVLAYRSNSSGPISTASKKARDKLKAMQRECKGFDARPEGFVYFDVKNANWESKCMASTKRFLTVKTAAGGLNPMNIREFNVQGDTANPDSWTNLDVQLCNVAEKAKKTLGGYAACAFVFAFPGKDDGDSTDDADWKVSPALKQMGWCPESDNDARNLFKFEVPAGKPYLSARGAVNSGSEIAFPFDVTTNVIGCKRVGAMCRILEDCEVN